MMTEEQADIRRAFANKAAIPPRFASKTLDGFETATAERKGIFGRARRYVKWIVESSPSCDQSILMHGNVGGGKTHLACAIMVDVLEGWKSAGYTAKGAFISSRSLAHLLREEIEEKKDRPTIAARLNHQYRPEQFGCDIRGAMNHSALVVIDDLGEEESDYAKSAIVACLMERYNSGRPTIFTTNLDWGENEGKENQVETRYEERFASRLRECCTILVCPELDFRSSAGAKPEGRKAVK